MGSRPTKAEGVTDLGDKNKAKQQALSKITALLANQEALDALCRDLFESMGCDGGRGNMSRSRLKMLTNLVINSCHVSDPRSLQELLDVLVPLHSRLTEDEKDVPLMAFDGFVSHARCVLRVVVAVLQVELDSVESELKVVDAYQKADQVFEAPNDAVNENGFEVPFGRRTLVDDRAVIITSEDVRDAHGSLSTAAAVVEATMPDSVIPGPLDEEPVAVQDVLAMESSVPASPLRGNLSLARGNRSPVSPGRGMRSPGRGNHSPVIRSPKAKAQILTASSIASAISHLGAPPPVLQCSFPMGSPPATPSLSIRAPQLVSLASSIVAPPLCLSSSLPSKSLRTSLSSASLGYSVDLRASVAASALPPDSGSRSRATTPRVLTSSRSATPSGGASVAASANDVRTSSRSTTPRRIVRKSIGRPCSPQSKNRGECVPVVIPSAIAALAALPDLHARTAIGRSHSPTRLTANSGRCSIRAPVGALCVAPMPALMQQPSESTAPAYLPLSPVLATPPISGSAPNGRSLSPLRPLMQLRAADVYTMPSH